MKRYFLTGNGAIEYLRGEHLAVLETRNIT